MRISHTILFVGRCLIALLIGGLIGAVIVFLGEWIKFIS